MDKRQFAILVADESERLRHSVRDTLMPAGYDVLTAGSGREAIQVIRQELVHVVVMDVRLPDYSGLEIYHAIKEIRDVYLPCIFTALQATADSLREAMSEDAITMLPKPLDMPRLMHAVDWSIDRFYARTRGKTGNSEED